MSTAEEPKEVGPPVWFFSVKPDENFKIRRYGERDLTVVAAIGTNDTTVSVVMREGEYYPAGEKHGVELEVDYRSVIPTITVHYISKEKFPSRAITLQVVEPLELDGVVLA